MRKRPTGPAKTILGSRSRSVATEEQRHKAKKALTLSRPAPRLVPAQRLCPFFAALYRGHKFAALPPGWCLSPLRHPGNTIGLYRKPKRTDGYFKNKNSLPFMIVKLKINANM
jgi:hypothetical protein